MFLKHYSNIIATSSKTASWTKKKFSFQYSQSKHFLEHQNDHCFSLQLVILNEAAVLFATS